MKMDSSRMIEALAAIILLLVSLPTTLPASAQLPDTHTQTAIVKIPVACLRTKPGHSSELSSQAMLGTPVKLIGRHGDWCHIITPDGYTGYMMFNSLTFLDDNELQMWKAANHVVCKTWLTRLVDANGMPCGYATYGVLLCGQPSANNPDMLEISMPDGTLAFAPSDDFYADIREWKQACEEASAENVISVAYSMLGCPYLWGGTSSLAPDCSGFTQVAYRAAGLLLPRDTSMQIKCGDPVSSIDSALPGDLVFFGNSAGRVNHVAIYLGEGKIIHSSGHVRICRLSANVPGDDELFSTRPIAIRRVLGVDNPVNVKSLINTLLIED